MTIYRNISEDGKEETYERLFCSQELTTGIHVYLIFLSVFNFLLDICSSLGKILILIALHKETCLHAPSKLFLRSLATTDLLVGVISEPLTITYWISAVWKRWDECYNTFFISIIVCYCAQTIYSNSSWRKFSTKPVTLLLEDQRSETIG